jgi:NAD(P)H-hydrate epimerase
MKIVTSQTAKQWDTYTIEFGKISSLDLMERAAQAFVEKFTTLFSPHDGLIKIFSGLGNNGADGILIARLLSEKLYPVEVFVVKYSSSSSKEFEFQLEQYRKQNLVLNFIEQPNEELNIEPNHIVIDAILGTGLNKPLPDLCNWVIKKINESGAVVVSVDIPTGLNPDYCVSNSEIILADYTLTFQAPKLSSFFPTTGRYYGDVYVLDIGLLDDFWDHVTNEPPLMIEPDYISLKLKPRCKFSHKGTFGHVLVVAGSHGFAGAAVLCAKASLKCGAGLTTVYVPKKLSTIIHVSVPEAMVLEDKKNNNYLETFPSIEKFNAIAIGPGLGIQKETEALVYKFIKKSFQPLVIDADAINILAENKNWLKLIPKNTIFTPHPKEFERLVGRAENDLARFELLKEFTKKYQFYCILKGAHTCISCPDGEVYFNTTGNPSMAKGGSGDVLTGIIAGLLAQGYSAKESCIIGVYWHGLAGDLAAKKKSEQSVLATDIIDYLGKAYKKMSES